MTHTPETGARKLAPDSGVCVMKSGTDFPVSGAGFWCVCHWHKTGVLYSPIRASTVPVDDVTGRYPVGSSAVFGGSSHSSSSHHIRPTSPPFSRSSAC